MKTRLTMLFCTLSLVACTYAPITVEVDPVSRGESHAHAAPFIYMVHDIMGMGSGWAWDEDTLVTNWHVVDTPLAMWVQQGEVRWHITDIERIDGLDAAFIHVSGPPLAVPDRRDGPLVVGEFITMGGHPHESDEACTTWGYVAGQYRSHEWFVDGSIIPGMSGGPVFDSEGRVIGMNEATTTGFGRPLGIIIPLEEIVDALDNAEPGPTGSTPSGGGRPGDPCPG